MLLSLFVSQSTRKAVHAVEMSNRAEYKSVASAMKLLTPHFLSFPVLKPLLLQNVSYTIYVRPVSHHLCFSPMINHRNTTHAILEFLWAICSAVVACSLFEPIPPVSAHIYFSEGEQREMLFFTLAEGCSVWVCCDCCLYYHYSFLPRNVNLMF